MSPYIGAALFFVSPLLFCVGLWFSDRRMRRGGGSGLRRWLATCVYSLAAIVVVLAFALVPTSMQFSSESGDIVAASYMFGLGWWVMGALAAICLAVGLVAALALFVRQGLTRRCS